LAGTGYLGRKEVGEGGLRLLRRGWEGSQDVPDELGGDGGRGYAKGRGIGL
jgi:hypothetical protein